MLSKFSKYLDGQNWSQKKFPPFLTEILDILMLSNFQHFYLLYKSKNEDFEFFFGEFLGFTRYVREESSALQFHEFLNLIPDCIHTLGFYKCKILSETDSATLNSPNIARFYINYIYGFTCIFISILSWKLT